MKQIKIIGRIIIGLVFVFSGVVKAIDPLGSAYKFHDYFQAFNLGFLDFLSLPLAIILCTTEFIAGFFVLTGIKQKAGIWGVMLLMALFTPLTFLLALTNPVSDCGCFGDAVHLTNWQTFAKNIVILALAIILFADRKKILNQFRPVTESVISSIILILFLLFTFGNLRYLPVIDFRPYKKGVKIADKMIIPEDEAVDEYHTTFIYQKDGVEKEFDLSNYPADDTSWKFIDQKTVLIKKGYQPPIHDFIITDPDGVDITQKILSHPGYSLLMVSKKLSESKAEHLSEGFTLGNYCLSSGIDFYILTASGKSEIENYKNGQLFCSCDETTLKTIVRANPGYILLREGVIIGKWSWANIPDKEWFREMQ